MLHIVTEFLFSCESISVLSSVFFALPWVVVAFLSNLTSSISFLGKGVPAETDRWAEVCRLLGGTELSFVLFTSGLQSKL